MFGVVESMRGLSCAECCYLDKSKKEIGKYGSCIYGCKSINRNRVAGYTKKDSELKTMGCSYCNKIKVGTSFTLNKTKCFYCGSIKIKHKRKYLVYNASTYVQNGYYVDVVEQSWFSEHIKDIVIECQTKEQVEELKQTAKLYKNRIEEREKENRIEIGTLFKLKSEEHTYTLLYCGKVDNEYLLYNQNFKTFKLVKSTWISEHIKRIQFCECNDTKYNTREDKIEFRKKIAKAKKERYIREHGCSRN